MPSLTFHLLQVRDSTSFLASLRSLPKATRPFYNGSTKHWIHEPKLSTTALAGTTASPTPWTHLLVLPSHGATGLDLPSPIAAVVDHKWSIAAPVDQTWLTTHTIHHAQRLASAPPPLPPGWNAADHGALDASVPPPDLSASLALSSRPLGHPDPITLQSFIPRFATAHPGPITMFNLLAYTPHGGREKYMGYVRAFQASTGVKYGGEAMFLGRDATGWSSQAEEDLEGEEGWMDCALVWYPSLWHFGKMLDDPGYAAADREFKQGAIRDNPLICCVEPDVGYVD